MNLKINYVFRDLGEGKQKPLTSLEKKELLRKLEEFLIENKVNGEINIWTGGKLDITS